ncbi:MAG: hypothetical protein J6K21_04815 [Bacilli bacterium]|nr:hypothetical protein [Bacilli bacterium]
MIKNIEKLNKYDIINNQKGCFIMRNEERVRCLNELSQLVTSNQLKFDDMNKISEEFFSKYIDILHIGKIEILSNVPTSIYDQQLKKSKLIVKLSTKSRH